MSEEKDSGTRDSPPVPSAAGSSDSCSGAQGGLISKEQEGMPRWKKRPM